ncbi:uncharacterized protein DUF3558 [Rhodococcus sp. OK519]|uniref:DUF3558 domain-containing protein n=1 Tax=Rhodococcus sp. OK519 TaxID=2135729 RepID=UPI000D35FA6D|nr:uncharacterized protein DUF3558 [Rhodococcus sp. OK519]
MRVTAVIGLIGAGLLLAGCGSGAVSGDAEAEGTVAGEPVFSPCDDIPDDEIAKLGFDPMTEDRDIMGVKQPGWNICGWMGAGPALSVFATTYTLDDVRKNEKNAEFIPVELNGRTAFSYREKSDEQRRSCDVAISTREGAALISVSYLGIDPVTEDPCSISVRATRALAAYLPA